MKVNLLCNICNIHKKMNKCKIFILQLYNAMTCVILIINKKSHTSKELWKIFKNVKIYNMFHQQLFISSWTACVVFLEIDDEQVAINFL
jgi:hypothetical protein